MKDRASLEQNTALHGCLKLASELVSRFFVSEIIFVPGVGSHGPRASAGRLVVFAPSAHNEIISYFEGAASNMGIKAKLELYDDKGLPSFDDYEKAISADSSAVVLYGKYRRETAKAELSEKILLEFDTSGLSNKDKIRLYQKLYGYEKSRNRKATAAKAEEHAAVSPGENNMESMEKAGSAARSRSYVYEGILQKIGGDKVGKSAMIFDPIHLNSVRLFFDTYNVRYATRQIYVGK
jgi:hypothetical protein